MYRTSELWFAPAALSLPAAPWARPVLLLPLVSNGSSRVLNAVLNPSLKVRIARLALLAEPVGVNCVVAHREAPPTEAMLVIKLAAALATGAVLFERTRALAEPEFGEMLTVAVIVDAEPGVTRTLVMR